MNFKRFFSAVTLAFLANVSHATDEWMYSGRIGGTFVYNAMSQADLAALLDQRVDENVSILELDSRLSYYLDDQEFATEVSFLDEVAELANARGMKAVIYYPTFEVLTANAIDNNGQISPDSFANTYPDWVQQGIDGTPNVFYGGQEVWVSPGEESAWMSPNTGYKDYFIDRVEQLAATDLDGIWLDVPIYLDTGTPWPGREPLAAAAFRDWSIAEGLNNGAGYTAPNSRDMNDPRFRAWVKWRHINVADFLEDVRAAAHAVNPDFAVVVENFPLDYLSSTTYGLDGTYLPVKDNFFTVWETDSVSNTQAMNWSTPDDFENKLAMLKWGKSVHPSQPSWSFSYGYEPLDAGLTMASTVATQNIPFESKTPTMLSTVDSDFRSNWFGYIRDHEEALFTDRIPEMAIWFSSATRDYQDYDESGEYGLYSVTTAPTNDDTWWASLELQSVVSARHLGGYRGMSAAMMRMNIPYTVVHGRDAGPLANIDDLPMLVLPSVGALSDSDAAYIRSYVQNGGVLLATGSLPGTLDETGATRAQSAIADLFAFPGTPAARVNRFGNGLAIYRPDIIGINLFGEQLDENTAVDTLTELEKLVRIHVNEPFTLADGENIYVDRAIASDNEHLLYLVNYNGLQLPLVQEVKPVSICYTVPDGKLITSVVASSPDAGGLNGFATVTERGNGVFKIDVPVDQFALLEIQLADAPQTALAQYAGPQFEDAAHAEAAQSGLAFILNRMRNSSLPEPNRFGVHTNLLDNDQSTEIYTGGHNVTTEHMGLLLRTSACMGDQNTFNEGFRYARDMLQSPLYHVPNWSIDKNRQQPFVFYDDFNGNWYNANAPLDDLRLIHGLIDGYENFGLDNANLLADEMLEGLYWTSVTDRGRNDNSALFPQYPGGLLGFAWDWAETDDATLTPASTATGSGYLGTDLLPVDYQDLGAIAHAALRDHRWDSVLQDTTQLLLDSEIALSGLYYNGYRPDGTWTGDFEYQGTRRGENLKTIQVLWTAIHLARVAKSPTLALTDAQKALARGSAARSLAFFKGFYDANGRVPEYLTYGGQDVADCVSDNVPENCLGTNIENLFNGEARIYAQMSRLALLLGDSSFSNQLINEKIITDRISDSNDPRYGLIGVSTAGINDAQAFDVLESVFSICLNAIVEDDDGPQVDNNRAPVANADNFATNEETALTITAAQLLGNDTDPDGDTLVVSGLPSRSANGGSIELQGNGDWVYTPASGFSGADSISYAVSDGLGGSAIGQVNVNVALVPKTDHLAESVTILSGSLNYGSIDFLTQDDVDTYDIDAATTTTGNVVDWYSSGRIDNRNEVSRLQVQYSGHYSIANVTQETFLYDFAANQWVSFDTRTVGDQTDSVVSIDITSDATDFIAADGETRIRIRGTQSSQVPTVWANSIAWKAYRGANANNTPPQAAAVTETTTANTAITIRLAGTDADNDPLTYSVDTGTVSGTVTGNPPLLTYLPPQGFTGTDSFSYSVSDGVVQSSPAVVTVTVLPQGAISNPASLITLDGNLNDWSGYVPFADDPADANSANDALDWSMAWMAHDGSDYYLAYQNHGSVDVSWGQTVYLDIDDNTATGYQAGLAIGADRVIQGRFLYSYTGTGDNWSWNFVTEVSGTSGSNTFEYQFPRSALNNSESIRVAFVGSNAPYGGATEDLYPDGVYDPAAANRFFAYTAVAATNSAPLANDSAFVATEQQLVEFTLNATDADNDALDYSIVSQPQSGVLSGTAPQLSYLPDIGFTGDDSFTFKVSDGTQDSRVATVRITVQSAAQAAIPSNPVNSITVDGDLSEWAALTAFAADPNDVSGNENPVDYLGAAMAHDGSNFYLSYRNDGQDVAALQEWLYTIYIDTDLNTATGYQSGLAIGADYMQQGSGVFVYSGTGTDWTWQGVAASERQALVSNVEVSLPRQAIGNPSQLRFVMIGDNLSIGGTVEDVYPDGTYDSSAAVRYLEYRTGGSALEPSILPAFDSSITPVFGRQEMSRNPYVNEQSGARVVTGGSGVFGLGAGVLLVAGFGLIRRRKFLH